ncbi:ABC transporter substrate-binding protein [Amnibacterium kyonggiense]|uniref:Multiple sugar transport system substrate-binding protein n=1 Tax=Amnibacterium kyonggiense TaxID=595671 RepID=A0A4R7FS84_9MICO|nr:extracellular solute-binding protein [Amnibacterium kyonggiense]TDS80636.1 multiple sugar transport system substrate-binding protein [Amnibacterium kyonggiense]
MPGIGSTQISRRQMAGILGLGAVTPLVLAACSGPGASTGGGGSHPTLSQWYHQYGEAGTEQAAKKYAASYKDATVNVNWVAGDYASKLNTRLLAGSGVDVFENNAINIADARAGKYADMTSIIEPIKDQFSETALYNVQIDGKYWGIPMIIDPQAFYYNKAMFSDAGLEVPTTMEAFYECVAKLSSGGKKGIFLSNTDGGAGFSSTMAWATGTDIIASDNKTNGFSGDVDALAETYSWFRKIQQNGFGLQGQPSDWWDITPFANRKIGIQWGGMWSMPQAVKALGDDVGMFPMPPSGSNGTYALIGSNWNQQVAQKSPNRKAALEFAKWLWVDQKQDQEDWALSYGFHIPPLKAVAASASKLQSGAAKEFVDAFTKYGKATGPYYTNEIGQAMEDAGTNIIVKGADAKTQLAAAAKKIDASLATLQ